MLNIFINEEFGFKHYHWEYPGTIDELIMDWKSDYAPWGGKPFQGTLTELPIEYDPENPFGRCISGTLQYFTNCKTGEIVQSPRMDDFFQAYMEVEIEPDPQYLRINNDYYYRDLSPEEQEITNKFSWINYTEEPQWYQKWAERWKETYSCNDPENENLIRRYVRGDLSPIEAERAEAHLGGCKSCSQIAFKRKPKRFFRNPKYPSPKYPSLAEVHPELVKEWDYIKNAPLKPEDIVPGSGKKIWWICSKDSTHQWQAQVFKRHYGSGCPECYKLHREQRKKLKKFDPTGRKGFSRKSPRRSTRGGSSFDIGPRRPNPGQYIKVYHISPHANIQHFIGQYSPKMKAKGIFVSESWISVLKDWIGTLSSKRFGGKRITTLKKRRERLERILDKLDWKDTEYTIPLQEKFHKYHQDFGSWKNLSIYTLLVPKNIFDECEHRMNILTEEAFKRQGYGALGAWSWGDETFILDEYLNEIKITGRQTVPVWKMFKLEKRHHNITWTQEKNIYAKLDLYKREINELIAKFGKAPLLDRAYRYANKPEINVRLVDNTRHFKILDAFLAPYRKQGVE